jgi:ribosomal protein S27E
LCGKKVRKRGPAATSRLLYQSGKPSTTGSSPMIDHCPGAANLRTPTLSVKKCPQCGEEVEIFSNDIEVTCSRCGFVVYNDMMSCIQWCKYAQECVGPDTYRRLTGSKKQ